MIAELVVRAVAATVPAGVRERYREEWLADLAGANGLGLSRWGVVAGALGLALGLDREDPATSGVPARRLAFRRMRIALASGSTALLLLLAGFWWGAWGDLIGGAATAWGGRVLLAAAVLAGAATLAALLGALRARRRARPVRGWTAADTAIAITAPLAVAATALVPFLGVPMLAAALLGFVVVLLVEDPRTQARPLRRGGAVALAAASASAILAMLAGTLLHVYVWNPLARMPGMTLDQIYAGLAAARELPSPVLPIGWAALWALAALALVVLAALPHPRIRRLMTARRLIGIGILGVALVAGGSWFVGFGMGMGMADAFATSGGDAAESGPLLGLVGFGFAIAAALVGLLPSRLPTPSPTPSEMQEPGSELQET